MLGRPLASLRDTCHTARATASSIMDAPTLRHTAEDSDLGAATNIDNVETGHVLA